MKLTKNLTVIALFKEKLQNNFKLIRSVDKQFSYAISDKTQCSQRGRKALKTSCDRLLTTTLGS